MSLGKIIGRCGASGVVHTGVGNCPKNEGYTVGLIITAKNAFYPIKGDEFKGKLQDYVGDTTVLRMMPIKDLLANEAAGGEVETNEEGFGAPSPSGLSNFTEFYKIKAGDCQYPELAKLNKRDVRIFRVDDEGYIYGTVVQRGDKHYFAGFSASVYARKAKTTSKTEKGGLFLNAYYSTTYEDELINANAVDVGLIAIPEGLVGVTLVKEGVGAKVIASCSNEDYTSDIEWTADAFVDASGVAPTAVSVENGILKFTPAGSYKVQTAAKLQTLDIFGIEGVGEAVTI